MKGNHGMGVYMIFSFNVTDREGFAPYGKAVTPVIEKHGAEVLAADFSGKSLEGNALSANVIIRFPSEENAMAFYNDPEYAPTRKLRIATTTDRTVVLVKEFVRP
jgi:uncharacterized protein (DUF1330 family)